MMSKFDKYFQFENTPAGHKASMKKLVYNAFIQVTFLRGLIEKRHFAKTPINEPELPSIYKFRDAQNTLVTRRFCEKFRGVSTAIDNEYLDELMLVIGKEEDFDDAYEIYTVAFTYGASPSLELNRDGKRIAGRISFREADIKKSAMNFLQEVQVLCHALPKLPDGCIFSLRSAFNDIAPQDGKAPEGWYETNTLYKFNHPNVLNSFEVGSLKVGSDQALMSVKSYHIVDFVEFEGKVKAEREARKYQFANKSRDESSVFSDTSLEKEMFPNRGSSPIISGTINGRNCGRPVPSRLKRTDDNQNEDEGNSSSSTSHPENATTTKTNTRKRGRKTKEEAGAAKRLFRTYRVDKLTPRDSGQQSPVHV